MALPEAERISYQTGRTAKAALRHAKTYLDGFFPPSFDPLNVDLGEVFNTASDLRVEHFQIGNQVIHSQEDSSLPVKMKSPQLKTTQVMMQIRSEQSIKGKAYVVIFDRRSHRYKLVGGSEA